MSVLLNERTAGQFLTTYYTILYVYVDVYKHLKKNSLIADIPLDTFMNAMMECYYKTVKKVAEYWSPSNRHRGIHTIQDLKKIRRDQILGHLPLCKYPVSVADIMLQYIKKKYTY